MSQEGEITINNKTYTIVEQVQKNGGKGVYEVHLEGKGYICKKQKLNPYTIRELSVHSSLKGHPHFSQIHDVEIKDRGSKCVMLFPKYTGDLSGVIEHVQGEFGNDIPNFAHKRVDCVTHIIKECVKILCIMHSNGIAHNDLKLKNILFEYDVTGISKSRYKVRYHDFDRVQLIERTNLALRGTYYTTREATSLQFRECIDDNNRTRNPYKTMFTKETDTYALGYSMLQLWTSFLKKTNTVLVNIQTEKELRWWCRHVNTHLSTVIGIAVANKGERELKHRKVVNKSHYECPLSAYITSASNGFGKPVVKWARELGAILDIRSTELRSQNICNFFGISGKIWECLYTARTRGKRSAKFQSILNSITRSYVQGKISALVRQYTTTATGAGESLDFAQQTLMNILTGLIAPCIFQERTVVDIYLNYDKGAKLADVVNLQEYLVTNIPFRTAKDDGFFEIAKDGGIVQTMTPTVRNGQASSVHRSRVYILGHMLYIQYLRGFQGNVNAVNLKEIFMFCKHISSVIYHNDEDFYRNRGKYQELYGKYLKGMLQIQGGLKCAHLLNYIPENIDFGPFWEAFVKYRGNIFVVLTLYHMFGEAPVEVKIHKVRTIPLVDIYQYANNNTYKYIIYKVRGVTRPKTKRIPNVLGNTATRIYETFFEPQNRVNRGNLLNWSTIDEFLLDIHNKKIVLPLKDKVLYL